MNRKLKRFAVGSLVALAWISVGTFFLWSAGAICYLTFCPRAIRVLVALIYFLGGIFLFYRIDQKHRWLSIVAGSVVIVYLLTLIQRPSNDRQWDLDQARIAEIEIVDDQVAVRNFRHCRYRTETDFDVEFKDLEFRLDDLTEVWFLVHKFSPLEGLAHTFLSFGVKSESGMEYFSVSVEIRREAGEVYSPIKGLYRQFELLYVVGDERDLIGVRTVMRPTDRVYLYRANATPGEAQALFLDIADRVSKLREQPEFYHTLLNNCTNGIVFHTYELTPERINWLSPQVVLPGFSDRVAFAHGLIGERGEPFSELRQKSRIDKIARDVGLTEHFSSAIRAQGTRRNDALRVPPAK